MTIIFPITILLDSELHGKERPRILESLESSLRQTGALIEEHVLRPELDEFARLAVVSRDVV